MIRRLILCIAIIFAGLLAAGFILMQERTEISVYSEYGITEGSRFFIVSDEGAVAEDASGKALEETVRTMDAQFAAAGIPSKELLPICTGKRKHAQVGDIVVLLDSDLHMDPAQQTPENACLPGVEEQMYRIRPMEDGTLEMTARTTDGLWYGMTELLQRCMRGDGVISETVTDAPESAERTLLLDCGRKYYSREWIQNLIRCMSWRRYTSLQLHFSDAEGMKFESEKYPWLNEEQCLSFADLEAICATAAKYHIEIIPELDSPGHLNYIVQRFAAHAAEDPSFTFRYGGKTWSAADAGGSISNYYRYGGAQSAFSGQGIDLSNDAARAFIFSLIDEYADFFAQQGCTKFGIGGDELFGWTAAAVGGRTFGHRQHWDALEHWQQYAREELSIPEGSAADTFIAYLNELNEHLQEKGYSCRVWNDELLPAGRQHVELDPDIDIIYWTNDYTPVEELVTGGHQIHSSNTDWCYYVIRQDKRGGDIMDRTRKYCNSEYIYEHWDPCNCAGPTQKERRIPAENFAGGYFCIWSDSPGYKSTETVWDDIQMRTWANAAKLWDHDCEEKLSYKKFRKRCKAVSPFPGYSGSCEKYTELPEGNEPQQIRGFWEKFGF